MDEWRLWNFSSCLYELGKISKKNNRGSKPKLMKQISTGQFAKMVFVDPNDLSVIYLEQQNANNYITNRSLKITIYVLWTM